MGMISSGDVKNPKKFKRASWTSGVWRGNAGLALSEKEKGHLLICTTTSAPCPGAKYRMLMRLETHREIWVSFHKIIEG